MRRRAAQGTFRRSHTSIPGAEVRRPGSLGSPAAPAVQASDWRLRIGRYRCVAWHRIALREARALPPSHIISHSLSAVALTVPQVAAMVDRQHRPEGAQRAVSLLRSYRLFVEHAGCAGRSWELGRAGGWQGS